MSSFSETLSHSASWFPSLCSPTEAHRCIRVESVAGSLKFLLRVLQTPVIRFRVETSPLSGLDTVLVIYEVLCHEGVVLHLGKAFVPVDAISEHCKWHDDVQWCHGA